MKKFTRTVYADKDHWDGKSYTNTKILRDLVSLSEIKNISPSSTHCLESRPAAGRRKVRVTITVETVEGSKCRKR